MNANISIAKLEINPSQDKIKKVVFSNGQEFTSTVVEQEKTVTITENGTVEITPSTGKDSMKKVSATVNVPPDVVVQEEKNVLIDSNGLYTVNPDSDFDAIGKVNVTVNVPLGGGASAYGWIAQYTGGDPWHYQTNFDVSPESKEDFLASYYLIRDEDVEIDGEYTKVATVPFDDSISDFTRVSDTEFTFYSPGGPGGGRTYTFTRDSSIDLTLWEES